MAKLSKPARGASLATAALLAMSLLALPVMAQAPAVAAEEEPEFKEAGYFALRLDFGGRRSPGAPVEVSLTARNYLGDRQGLQYNTNSFHVVGSNGAEYKWDGNYSASRAPSGSTTPSGWKRASRPPSPTCSRACRRP